MPQRLLVYNIAYATGAPAGLCASILGAHRYLKASREHFERICHFIAGLAPDIIGLVEVDTGSFRSSRVNHAEELARRLKYYAYCTTKYGYSLPGRLIPILRKQGNAVLARERPDSKTFHFFPGGFKRLVIELDTGDLRFFLVHLALSAKLRRIQLEHLAELASSRSGKPLIVAGDFNTFGGRHELAEFKDALRLRDPNVAGLCTYPAWEPKHQLDFVLCSKEVRVSSFQRLDVRLSDHLPLLLDFELGL